MKKRSLYLTGIGPDLRHLFNIIHATNYRLMFTWPAMALVDTDGYHRSTSYPNRRQPD
jgi:hypothetical protein